MSEEILCRIALTLVPQIGDIVARSLLQTFGSAKAIFEAPYRKLEQIEHVGSIRANAIKKFTKFYLAEKELKFLQHSGIKAVSILDETYPEKLRFCADAPALIYAKGNVEILQQHSIAIIGTRSNTNYGKTWCIQFIDELKSHKINIISGLAYGIDTIAHQAALETGMTTTAVLAHGLHTIYPEMNTVLAKQISNQGLLVTEFREGAQPDKQNFPRRNRITAGLADAVVVIETGERGGSMITADLAHQYNREVFALPGRSVDMKSAGCNLLIKQQKAQIITSAKDLLDNMGWNNLPPKKEITQRVLPLEISDEQKLIISVLEQRKDADIDQLQMLTNFSYGSLSSVLLELELMGLIEAMPGKKFRVL